VNQIIEQTVVPFHRAAVGEQEAQAAAEVIRSGWLTMGPKTVEFERKFAEYVESKHAVAVSSCTAALHLSLEAVGITCGDEILVPTTTFAATAEVATYFGARPVLVDIDPRTLNLDCEDAARRITRRTRAIIPVHLAGQPCDMARIHALASSHNLHVIEDAAHALPATYQGTRIGSLSELTAFSFYAIKTLTTGEGGMVTTNNDSYADRIRLMRLHGIGRDAWKRYSTGGSWYYEVLAAGYKYNMTDIQAALGLVQLAKCDELCCARRRIAERYTSAFERIESVEVPTVEAGRDSSWHLYILRLRLERLNIDRDRFAHELGKLGVGTSVHFIPLHLHPLYQSKFGYRRGDFPNAEAEYLRCVSLPIWPTMTNDDVECVVRAVTSIVRAAEKRGHELQSRMTDQDKVIATDIDATQRHEIYSLPAGEAQTTRPARAQKA
jgi:dTDP-4-amino-4,6-dideoxygalactose transaminase